MSIETIKREVVKVEGFLKSLEIENYRLDTIHLYGTIIQFEVNMFGYHNFGIKTDNFLYFKNIIIFLLPLIVID